MAIQGHLLGRTLIICSKGPASLVQVRPVALRPTWPHDGWAEGPLYLVLSTGLAFGQSLTTTLGLRPRSFFLFYWTIEATGPSAQ